jgi:hypothetical protein
VSQLNCGARALQVNELNNALEGGNVGVAPKAKIAGRDAPHWMNGRGFENDQACAALCAAAEMDEVPISGEAVL